MRIPIVQNSVWLWTALLSFIACHGCEKPKLTDEKPKLTVVLETTKGEIAIELYPGAAPKTVENFITLIQQGFYNGLTFHRYAPDFVIQGGDPTGNGRGGPGWAIYGEFQDPELRAKMPKHEKGVVAMARKGTPNSAGSQFYICLNSDPDRYNHLEGDYTTFGRVVEGLDVVDRLRKGDKMNKVTLKHYSPQ